MTTRRPFLRWFEISAWSGRFRPRLWALGGMIGLMWLVELVDWFVPGSLVEYGIRPRSAWGLLGILFAPFVHRDVWHLLANTLPLAILGAIVLLGGVPRFARVTGAVAGLGGLAVWACGEEGVVHVGASGLVFGYFGYLVARGYFDRSPGAIAVALTVGILYSGLLWGVLPLRTDLSWLGHLCGLLSGSLCARLMRRRGGPSRSATGAA